MGIPGHGPSTAWNKSLAQAKVRKPEFVPGIPGVPDRNPEPTPAATPSGYRVDDEVRAYLTNVAKLASKTHKATSGPWTCFKSPARKSTFTSKQDLQKFDTDLIAEGNEDRTRHNRIQHVVTFLKNKEGRRLGPPITDVSITVKFVEDAPEAYTRLELEDLFRVSDEDERFCWRFFLGSGFRESEASVAGVTDVNRDTKTIQVIEKTEFGSGRRIVKSGTCLSQMR